MQSRPEWLYRPLPQQKDGEMNQVEKAARFSELHVKSAPLLLYNAWDAGTAKSILDAGAKAIATSSWAVAETQGYRDGESIPIRSEEHTSELQSHVNLVCRLLLEKKNKIK